MESNILIFGGTTEGRKAVAICEEAAKPFYYSTKGALQPIELAHGIALQGAMDKEQLAVFCRERSIRLLIDAAHPFAMQLHENIVAVATEYAIPVIRLERIYPRRDKSLEWFENYAAVIEQLVKQQVTRPLFLTGVNTLAVFKPYWQQYPSYFRILNRQESLEIARREGFPEDNLLYYGSGETDEELLARLRPQVMITKESGETGGFTQKVQAACGLDIPVWVVCRPQLSSSFTVVNGEHGLRREIEKQLPGFFALRTGYTTGTCATAATKAALEALLTGEHAPSVKVTLPNRETIEIAVASTTLGDNWSKSAVIKDAGDDPDVTNGMTVEAAVRLVQDLPGIRLLGGDGVGTVTLPGLGIEPGEPAINRVPREMIAREVAELLQRHADCLPETGTTGVEITLSVPGGKEIAKRTFNPRLGIEGGISIIGTSGIVRPFSSEAFIESIHREMEVARATGCRHVVINSGAKSERLVKQLFPGLPPQAFIHYGNFIGETLRIATELEIPQLTMGIMIGKAAKLAAGALDTHSKKVTLDLAFLESVAREAGCDPGVLASVRQIHMARQLEELFPNPDHPFYSLLVAKCYVHCRPLYPDGELEIRLVRE
ncbi:MAG: cobalt-precorrin-5B (C(1))-methyltransferase CbiD [Tannerellaceae bacterium]|nr:cobalt-precorrin-5B (C(1))-methyltransferase CbiD [Tannerellaceae bacterium]